MDSKISVELQKDTLETCKQMTPMERVRAFISLSRAVAQFYQAGIAFRAQKTSSIQTHSNAEKIK